MTQNHSTVAPSKREIRKILKANWGSQARVAEAAGVKPNTISMWIRGKSPSRRLDSEVPEILRRMGLLQ